MGLLRAHSYDVVIPLFDHSAEVLAENKKQLSQWTHVAVNDYPVFVKARHKLTTMRLCMENGIPCPRTCLSDGDARPFSLEQIGLPVVVKPRRGEGAKGFCILCTPEQLESILRETETRYGRCLVQEYIPQSDMQYKAEVFVGNDTEVKAAVVFSKVRFYPIRGGSSTLNMTVDRPDIVRTCSRLLQIVGWRGYADIDLIQDPRDGVAKVMEINPRITGSVRIAFDAGVDFAEMIVKSLLDEPVGEVAYEVGRQLRFFHKDLLWFIRSPDRLKAKPSWFRFFDAKTSDQILSLEDPLPGVAFTIECLRRLFGNGGLRGSRYDTDAPALQNSPH